MTNETLRGKPYAGNPHVRFDDGEVASGEPRRGSLLYKVASVICRVRLMAVALFAAFACLFAHADDVTYYVSTTGDDSNSGKFAEDAFRNPQTAIDLADGKDKVIVKIAAGTYTVKNFATDPSVINITNSNVFVEAIEPGAVIIDGQSWSVANLKTAGKNANRAVTVAADLTDVTLKGIVFQNGSNLSGSRHGSDPYSSTLFAQSGLFRDCKFIGKNFWYSSTMFMTGSSVASNCVFTLASSVSTTYGYGDYAVAVYGNAKILDSTIEEFWRFTKADTYAMIVGGSAVISNTVIRNTKSCSRPRGFSSTRGYGSGIRSSSSAVVVMNGGSLIGCTVTNLMAFGNVAIVKANNSSVTLKDNIFWNNKSTGLLGDVTVSSGSPTITGNTSLYFADDANGNTSFEPWQEFCTSNSISAGKAPFKVRFRNRTNDENAVWDFGDGSEQEIGATPEHTYDKVGKYTVKMTLAGKTTTRTDYIVATGPKMYVSKTGSSEKPYDTEAKAAAHPQDAIDLAPDGAGTEIIIDDGKYTAREPAKDDTILEIQKSGITLRAKNGEGRVWIDSQRTTGNGLARMNLIIGKGMTDVLVDSLVLTNGYTTGENGSSCALLGSGVCTNCTFDIYRLSETGGVYCEGPTCLTCCRFTSAAPSLYVFANYDYALGLAGSSCLVNSIFKDVNVRGTRGYSNPVISLGSSTAAIRNCLIVGCKSGASTSSVGRGAIAASAGTIENCTIVGNETLSGQGGGVYLSSASVVFRNNIVWGNSAPTDDDKHNIYAADYSGCTYSASPDLEATEENHNVKLTQGEDPGFTDYAGGDYSLKLKTLLTGAGSVQDWMEDAVDLARKPRLYDETVSMGAYEPQGRDTSLLGDFSVTGAGFGRAPYEATFSSTVSGGKGTYLYQWDFGDGTVTDFTSDGAPSHTYASVGSYSVTLTVTDGTVTNSLGTKANLAIAVGDTCYLRPDQDGVPPYDTWAKATSNIEAAVALLSDTVIATNGTYYVTNIKDKLGLKLDRAITVKSVEGPEKTTIARTAEAKYDSQAQFPNATLTHKDAVLDGFSLTRAVPPCIVASAGLVQNCIVTNMNKSYVDPLTKFSGTSVFSNSVIDATEATFEDTCDQGAGICASGYAQIVNCEVRNLKITAQNRNSYNRGGIVAYDFVTIRNCYVHDVFWSLFGWGADKPQTSLGNTGIYALGNATVDCCTVTRCWSKYHPGGGINAGSGATIRNCIVYGNTGAGTAYGKDDIDFDMRPNQTPVVFANNLVGVITNDVLPTTATACLPLGTNPQFVTNGPAYRIELTSPCVDAGTKLEWCSRRGVAVDIEGQERRRQKPDIGCYELPRDTGLQLLVR